MDSGSDRQQIDAKDRKFLGLAVKCRLISGEQEKQFFSEFLEEARKSPGLAIVPFLEAKGYLAPEEINFVFAVQDHLKMKMLDKKFGELGVANKFIHPENVKKALSLQNEIFKQTNESKLIGDILLEQKEITKANKAAILLTQDRVSDEFLAEAINDIAANEMERISISMRFGAIAVRKGIITLDQLNQALEVQRNEKKEKGESRYLGEILKELFGLPKDALAQILKIQKEFEKQRMSLEKALATYNLETSTQKQLNKLFDYRFSKSKLSAYIRIVGEMEEEVEVSDVVSWLDSIGIRFGICARNEIEAFLEKREPGSEMEVAKGRPPLDPVNESVEFMFETGATNDAGTADEAFVKKGDILAKITPHKEGKPGKDVCGFDIAPPDFRMIPLSCGEGVVKKETLFLAEIEGMPTLFKNRTLFVTPSQASYPTKHLSGNVRSDLGDQYQSANLRVEGDVEPGGRVLCHELSVKGDVKGQARATGAIHIEGSTGIPSSDGHASVISSDKTISISKTILNTIIITSESLMAPNSDLVSSKVFAFQDVVLKNVYSEEDQACALQIGKNPNLKTSSIDHTIEEKKHALDKLRQRAELEEIEGWFKGKIAMQNIYLEQHAILQDLLKLDDDEAFNRFDTLDQKALELLKQVQAGSVSGYSEAFGSEDAGPFIRQVFADIRDQSQANQKDRIRETADIKFGMYKAAVNATRRYEAEYHARKEMVAKKLEGLAPEIAAVEQEIDDLYVKKDFLKLSESRLVPSVNPSIRVKNRVAKGTVIKGRKSVLVVDKDIFGVKFIEQQKSSSDPAKIVITGFYE